jgi:hypothetical protein
LIFTSLKRLTRNEGLIPCVESLFIYVFPL